MAVSKEDIIANLRAIIISSKGGLKLSDVRSDYRETFGVDVPLREIGYSSLEEFFKNNSKDFSIIGNRVQAMVKVSSGHIALLVSKQQNSKKRGRSKLAFKQARHLRKPTASYNQPYPSGNQTKKFNQQSFPPRFSKQSNNKDSFSTPPSRPTQAQQTAGNMKNAQHDIQNIDPKRNQGREEKHHSQNQLINLEELKGFTRTIKNDRVLSAKEPPKNTSPPSEIGDKGLKEVAIPFEDFEDLHISNRAQSRLLKLKSTLDRKMENLNNSNGGMGDSFDSSLVNSTSPFKRSLANNSQQEIMSAKNFAQTRRSPTKTARGKTSPDLVIDLEDDTKYEDKLKQFCTEKGLVMPKYSVITREANDGSTYYGCILTIGSGFQVSTFPTETSSLAMACELASKKAYTQLSLNNNLPGLYETEQVIQLRELCLKKNLPLPQFKSIECHPKNEPKYFICKVRIGEDILLSSYPVEAQDELTARDIAAKKAYDHLSSTSKSPSKVSKDNAVVISQLFNILRLKEYGVWSSKLPIMYSDIYNEELQSNWFDIVKSSPVFEIDTIEKVGHIIRAKTDMSPAEDPEEPPVLATLKLPESNQWEVYITNVVTSAEVWCRLLGNDYSEVYDTMMTKLELQPPTIHVKAPVLGGVYLVNLEESWNRVKVIDIFPEKEEASVFLIDIGLEEVVKISTLFQLHKSFFSVAPQAILLSLNELDFLAECEELKIALFHSLLGNTFVAEVVAILDEGGNVTSVNLWDTSNEDDVNVNLKLLDDVIKTVKSPSLPTVGLVKEMFVSHVDDSGDIYVQTSKQNAHFIDWMISTKMKNCGTLVPVNNKKVDSKKLYVTRCNKTGLFYRAKLYKNIDSKTVIVKFIDYGYEQQAAIDDLFDLEETSLDLAMIPSQAIRVKFANLKVANNSKALAKIREYVLEQSVLVKVTEMQAGSPPSVELLKRSQSDGTLSSVNNNLKSEQLEVVETPTRKKSYVVGLENNMFKILPMPNIPPVGGFFDVFVTLAAHPGLFNVQPLISQNDLMKLMFRLQENCETTFSKPLAAEDFKIGELYAVKHADDYWYRAYAHAVVSPSAYTVFLCDFGDFIIVPAEKLMPLSSEFKTFPYQAIRAYLAGVAPVNIDWSALDCVSFRELVIEKRFVSKVVEIKRDVKNPNYISLGLILVDTSTTEDVYIHQLLIDKKIAVSKS